MNAVAAWLVSPSGFLGLLGSRKRDVLQTSKCPETSTETGLRPGLDLSLNPFSSSLQLPRAKVTAFLGWSSSRLLPRLALSSTLGRGCRRNLLTPKPLFVKLNQTPGFSKLGSLYLSLHLLLCHPGRARGDEYPIYHHCRMKLSISGSPITMEICKGTIFSS